MEQYSFKSEFVDKYVNDFTSRIVAETGIPSDRYHLGKIIMQCLKDDPDFVMQVDDQISDTNGSVLRWSIQCATSFRNMGLKTGDVIVLMSPNHLHQALPFYAALFLGIAIAPIDRNLGVGELRDTFNISKPKLIFCQNNKVQDVQKAVDLLGLDAKIISFDKSPDVMSFTEFIKYDDNDDADPEEFMNFRAADFDPEKTIAFLISTSGTTGLPKAAMVTHMNIAANGPYVCNFATKVPATRSALLVAPLQWLSSILHYVVSPFFRYTRIHTSQELTAEHTLKLIKEHKPTFIIISPTMMTSLLKAAKKNGCDFSSFEVIYMGGSAVPRTLIEELRIMLPKAIVTDVYGMSEVGSMTFYSVGPLGSCGKPYAHMQYKLVNIETGEEIKEPHKNGELWLKTIGGFKGYYNNPEATAEATSKDGWFMTGDIMYRDEQWNFYFVERIKLLLKYKNNQISPVEVESVIRQHPGVLDVAVTSLPDQECGDLPVACIVQRPGVEVNEQEIKDLVKENLADSKQLRGGVIFVKELPLTASTKIHRRKLKEMVLAIMKKQIAI